MPDEPTGVKISLLPSASSLADADVLAGVQGNTTKKFSLSALKAFITAAITAAGIGAVPDTRKVNNKALSSDITLDASDVGAVDSSAVGAAGGVASLGNDGKVPSGQLPSGMGGVPTGTVIYYAGIAAPSGYLACDGTTYNIADYSDLANFFNTNYGSVNYWGGDGTVTFKVPDWRGEFFRGSGTNSRTGQGSGGNVGVHQDATLHVRISARKSNGAIQSKAEDEGWLEESLVDAYSYSPTNNWIQQTNAASGSLPDEPQRFASRPTNTSLLVCIKY